jgi:hypothetical protein
MDDMSNMDMSGMEHMNHMAMTTPTPTLTDAQVAGLVAMSGIYLVFGLILAVISVIASWKIFSKAGQAGWKSLIPIYNVYVLLQIVGRPEWWLLLLIIPGVNIVISLILSIDLGKSFGKSTAYSVVLLWLFSLVGYCLLAFGSDQYLGPGGNKTTEVASDVPPTSTSPTEPNPPEPQVQLT